MFCEPALVKGVVSCLCVCVCVCVCVYVCVCVCVHALCISGISGPCTVYNRYGVVTAQMWLTKTMAEA